MLLLLLSVAAEAPDWKTYPYNPPGASVSFPADEGDHPEYHEWWYFNFHLTENVSGKNFSAMVAFFDVPLPFRILNIVNETDRVFASIVAPRSLSEPASLEAATGFMELYFPHFAGVDTVRNLRDGSGRTLPFAYELHTGNGQHQLDLEMNVIKRPLLVGQDGLVSFAYGDSYYYSYTRLSVNGSVTLHGVTHQVTGIGWFDHQYGPFLSSGALDFSQTNYEWFSVQFDNGMDLSFWGLFRPSKDQGDGCGAKVHSRAVEYFLWSGAKNVWF